MNTPVLSPEAGAIRVRKLPVDVTVRFAAVPGRVATLEGEVGHAAGDAMLTGGEGEHWPVARARFDATYEPVPPTVAGQDGQYRKRPIAVLARRLEGTFSVPVGDGHDRLSGGAGDWLVQYGPGEFGIVSAAIFAATYEIL